MKKLFYAGVLSLLASAGVYADTILAPDFAGKKVDYVNAAGKKVYGDITSGKPLFSKGGIELKNQGLYYEAKDVINLNNGTLSFDIEPLNFSTGKWKSNQSSYITLFTVSSDKGFTQFWLYLYPHANQLCFYSWDNNRTIVQARGNLGKIPKAMTLKQKTRVVCTWDPQFIRLYVNGEEIANASYGLGSDRIASEDMLIRFTPPNYMNPKKTKYHSRISNLYLTDTTKSSAELKAEYAASKVKTSDILNLNKVVAPKFAVKPVIDGKISPGEWADAAEVPLQKQNEKGLIDSSVTASARIKHGDNKLYVLFDVQNPQKPIVFGKPDTFSIDVYNGSLVELYLRKPGSTRNDFYQFTVAPNNCYSVITPNAKRADLPFEHKTAVMPGRYQVEMAIDLTRINMQDLEKLLVNFGLFLYERDDLSKFDRWIAWSGRKGRISFAQQCGELVLGKDNSASQLPIFKNVNYGVLTFDHTSTVPSKAELTLRDGTGKVVLQEKFADAKKLNCNKKLNWIGGGFLDFRVMNEKGDLLNTYSGVLLIKEPFDVTYSTYPSKKKIEFAIDANGLGKAAVKNLKFTATLKDGTKVLSTNSTKLPALRCSAALDLPELKPGKYTLELTLNDGRSTYRKSMKFVRPDDDFLRNPKGMERIIPAPWSSMSYSKDKIQGSFFEYTLQKNTPFPASASKLGKAILTGSELDLVVNGKKQSFVQKNFKVVENAPDRVVLTGEMVCSDAPLKVTYRCTAAYDGMLKYDLKLVPEKPVTVNRFSWSGSVVPEMAVYCLDLNKSPTFAKEYYDAPTIQYRTHYTAWVTGLQYGFTVFTDNDANWYGNDPLYNMLVDKSPERTTLTAEMIAKDVVIKRPIPYVLGLMSTPGKPPRTDWRQTYSGAPIKPNTGGTYYRSIGWGHERNMFRWYRWILLTHLWNPEAAEKRVAYFKKRGAYSVPYCCANAMPDSNDIYNYYGHEWRRSVKGRLLPPCEQGTDIDGVLFYGAISVCCNNKGFADYMTYYTDKYLQKYDLYGLYLDFGGAYPTDAPYQDTDLTEYLTPGKKVAARNLFGLRDLYERLRKIIQSHGKDKILWVHEWDRYHPAFTSFTDLIYPGEEFMHSIRVNPRVYGEETPLAQWQVAYSSYVHGASVQFLTQYRYYREPIHNLKKSAEEKIEFARDLMTMVLLHDITMSDTFTGKWHQLWDELEMKKADFKSYYTGVPVVTDNASVKTAMYTWKDRKTAVLILGNVTNKPQSFKINDQKFKLKSQAKDLFKNATVDLSKEIKFRDFDFLVLEVTPDK